MILAGFSVSCVSTTDVQQNEAFSSEEESDFFNDEEDVFEEELEEPVSSTAENDLQQEEKEAESELEGIEGEFAEFIEEEEEEDEKEDIETTPEVQEEMVLDPSQENVDVEENIVDSEIPVEETNVEQIDEPIVDTVEEPEVEDFVETEQELSSSNIQVTDIRYEQGQVFIDTVGGELSYRSRFNESTRQQIIEISQAVIIDQLKWPYIMKEFQSNFALLQADQKTDDTVRIVIQMRPESSIPTIVQKKIIQDSLFQQLLQI